MGVMSDGGGGAVGGESVAVVGCRGSGGGDDSGGEGSLLGPKKGKIVIFSPRIRMIQRESSYWGRNYP